MKIHSIEVTIDGEVRETTQSIDSFWEDIHDIQLAGLTLSIEIDEKPNFICGYYTAEDIDGPILSGYYQTLVNTTKTTVDSFLSYMDSLDAGK